MRSIVMSLIAIISLIGCEKEIDKTKNDLSNINGFIEIHRCFCASSAFRYLIVTYNKNDTVYYNPINLSDEYKDFNYKVVLSAELLTDSSIVYTNTATDALIEDFKVRNIRISNIGKCSDLIINDTMEIDYGKTYYDYNDMISIGIDSVIEDSRCPSGVMCVWEGNAKVRFNFIQNNNLTKFSLNTANSFRKDTLVAGYKIQMINVKPYPVYPDFIKQNDYTAIIKIIK